ncbi:hypothetical protein ACIRQP_41905 [Streptomyces sp. NPDC102274]|uniref:hypothetical protein n=1 Tax=Streptomyces sp. NPDC102274 TaxID=3366151 RepID=UPI0037F25E4D
MSDPYRILVTTAPVERCGELTPHLLAPHRAPEECVLHPGHSGSHADEHSTRWWSCPTSSKAAPVPTPNDNSIKVIDCWFPISQQRAEDAQLMHAWIYGAEAQSLTSDPEPDEDDTPACGPGRRFTASTITDGALDELYARLDAIKAIQPYDRPVYGDRSIGYQMGWNACRETIRAALDSAEQPTT